MVYVDVGDRQVTRMVAIVCSLLFATRYCRDYDIETCGVTVTSYICFVYALLHECHGYILFDKNSFKSIGIILLVHKHLDHIDQYIAIKLFWRFKPLR